MPVHSQSQDLRRVIGLFGGIALIVGITVGSGIFRTPPTIAGLVPHSLVIMGLWTAFGLISICGALAVAELSSLLPQAGLVREATRRNAEGAFLSSRDRRIRPLDHEPEHDRQLSEQGGLGENE